MDSQTIITLIGKVCGPWMRQRKREERDANARLNRHNAMTRSHRVTLKDAVNQHIAAAYLAVSSNGTLPAMARQIMYDVRRRIQDTTEQLLKDAYFTQKLLRPYMRENPITTAEWDVVFDSRGHFTEPHTKREVALGTLDVRKYLSDSPDSDEASYDPADLFPTHGPRHRFGAALFIEKEGWVSLFTRVKLAERYDVAIMSTKGLSVIASRRLVDHLCGEHDIPLLVLHDFDKAGFSIAGTLSQSNEQYKFRHKIRSVDLGLRLKDVEKWNLESEAFHTTTRRSVMQANLIQNGATKAEAEFISRGRRVELNAFTSADLVKFIEGKLVENGVKKIIPDVATQEAAFRRALKNEFIQRRFEKLKADADEYAVAATVPRLKIKIAKMLKDDSSLPWDEAVRRIAGDAFDQDGDVA